MKLKQQPEDFQVEELTDVVPQKAGAFALYRLEKRGLGTPEAVQAICRRWQLEFRQVGYGGLKDRHAVTTQFLTIWRGPRRGLKQQHLHLHYLGQLAQPFSSETVRGNRFQLTLRDLNDSAVKFAESALADVERDGVPNYFDDQRFGSVGRHDAFVARKLIACDYEGALRLALAEPYEFDRPAQKEEKKLLRAQWGQWATVQKRLPQAEARHVVAHLVDHPTDFRGAFARLRADLKSLYLAAYQSHLWNRMLARWLEQHCRAEQLVTIELRMGRFPVFRQLAEAQRQALRQQTLPLPSSRLKLADDDPVKPVVDEVLAEDGLELAQMKLKHFREPFFSKGDRAVLAAPEQLTHEITRDELHAGQRKLVLQFNLPRGSYATMVVKRITLAESR